MNTDTSNATRFPVGSRTHANATWFTKSKPHARYALKRQIGCRVEWAVSQHRGGLLWLADISKAWRLRWDFAQHLSLQHGGVIVAHPDMQQMTLPLGEPVADSKHKRAFPVAD